MTNKNTGLALHLYTTKEELDNAKNGISTIVGWTKEQKPVNAYYHISVSMDICDILEKEVRVNVSKTNDQFEAIGLVMGETFGKEFSKLIESML
jgi:hypothetical protein